MSIGVAVIAKKANGGFSLWVSEAQGFVASEFFDLVEPLVQDKERVLQSFGPAEYIDDFHTAHGTFSVHREFDGYAGTTLYSDDPALITKIRDIMLSSGLYHLRA